MNDSQQSWEGWAILELMGHRRIGGFVSEVSMFGTAMLRIDIPGDDGVVMTQFYSGSSIYCLTPTTEAMARAVAAHNTPVPVQRWELPDIKPAPYRDHQDDPGDEYVPPDEPPPSPPTDYKPETPF